VAHLFGDPQEVVLFSKKFPEDRALLVEARRVARALGRGVLLLTRKPERLDSEAIGSVLGTPFTSQAFENWWAVEYRPEEGPLRPPGPTRG
jgi:hypothetical protein